MAFLQFGYYFPVSEQKNLLVKDDSSLYRFQVLLCHYQYHHNSPPYHDCHHHHSCAPHHHNCLYLFNIFVTIFSSIANVLTDQHRQQTTFVNRNDLVIHIFFCQQCYTHNMNMKSKILLQHGLPKNFFGLFCHES